MATTLTNSSTSLAFLIRWRVTNGGNEVLPVLWSDNYITLLPGESRTETATFNAGTLPAGSIVQVDGFNINPQLNWSTQITSFKFDSCKAHGK